MKQVLLFCLLLPCLSAAQECGSIRYRQLLQEADIAVEKGQYDLAINKLQSAKICQPKREVEVNTKILAVFEKVNEERKAAIRNADEARRQKKNAEDALARFHVSFASYLTAEARKAFEKEDIRLAWRLAEIALRYDPDNLLARELKSDLPNYFADIYLSVLQTKLSPDSSSLLFFTKENDGSNTLHLLNLRTQAPIRSFANSACHPTSDDPYSSYSATFEWSPDGRYLVFLSDSTEGTWKLNIFKIDSQAPPLTFSMSEVFHWKYSPDGRWLIFSAQNEKGEKALNLLKLGENDLTRSVPDGDFNTVRFSPDHHYLTFGSQVSNEAGILNIVNLESKGQIVQFAASNLYIHDYDYSPDMNYLVFFTNIVQGSFKDDKFQQKEKGTLNVLRLDSMVLIHVSPDTYMFYIARDFSPDSRYFFFFTNVDKEDGSEGDLHVLDMKSRTDSLVFSGSFTFDIEFSPDSRHLLFLHGDKQWVASIFGFDNYKIIRSFFAPYGSDYYFSPDGKYFVPPVDMKYSADTLRLQKTESSELLLSVPHCHPDEVKFTGQFLSFLTDVKDGVGTLNIVCCEEHPTIQTFANCPVKDNSGKYQVSPDGRYAIFISDKGDRWDATLTVLDLSSAKITSRTFSDVDIYERCGYSSNSKYLIFYSFEDKKSVLNILELGAVKPPRSYHNPLKWDTRFEEFRNKKSYEFSKDGKYIFFYTRDKQDILNIQGLDSPYAHYALAAGNLDNYAYSPDCRRLIAVIEDNNMAEIFDFQTGAVIRKAIRHRYPVKDVKFISNDLIETLSVDPVSGNFILKLYRPSVGEKYVDYYLDQKYDPLSKEEKKRYGIPD